jgi:hypothetical protein
MTALLASIAALGLIASPALAATKKVSPSTKTVTTKSGNTKATTMVSTKGNTTTAKTTVTKTPAKHRKMARNHAKKPVKKAA